MGGATWRHGVTSRAANKAHIARGFHWSRDFHIEYLHIKESVTTTITTKIANNHAAGPNCTCARSLSLTKATAQPSAKISAIDQGFNASDRRNAGFAKRAGGRSRMIGVNT